MRRVGALAHGQEREVVQALAQPHSRLRDARVVSRDSPLT